MTQPTTERAAYPPLALSWRSRPGVAITRRVADELEVTVDGRVTEVLRPGTATLAAMLERFQQGSGLTSEDLVRSAEGDLTVLARMYYALARFISNGLLVCEVLSGGRQLATMIPRRRGFEIQSPPAFGREAILSRFAYLRRFEETLLLACPGAACEMALHGAEPGGWFAAAAQPVALGPADGPPDERAALYRLAVAHGLLELVGESEPPNRASWEFHDRLFHHAARSFDDFVVRGGTFRFRERFPSPPAIRQPHQGEDVALPELEASESRSLREVMSRRRSRREMSERPVSLAAVSEVMHRAARMTACAGTGPQQTIRRPYPSGGSLHELEFYLAVHACQGLGPGFYHYRSEAHQLTMLPSAAAAAEAMLAFTANAWDQPGRPPQVHVVIASRLPRLAWKYAGIAYKVSLLNAGVAIQSLYLVTSDMGLAGCAVGSGDPGLFEQATGCDSFEETSVAEFGFGVPATSG